MYTTCIIWLAFVPIYFGTGNSFEVFFGTCFYNLLHTKRVEGSHCPPLGFKYTSQYIVTNFVSQLQDNIIMKEKYLKNIFPYGLQSYSMFCILTMLNQLILGLKKKFQYNHFSKKSLSFLCGTFYIAPKPLKKSICGMLWLQQSNLAKMGFCRQSMPQMLFLSALGAK